MEKPAARFICISALLINMYGVYPPGNMGGCIDIGNRRHVDLAHIGGLALELS